MTRSVLWGIALFASLYLFIVLAANAVMGMIGFFVAVTSWFDLTGTTILIALTGLKILLVWIAYKAVTLSWRKMKAVKTP